MNTNNDVVLTILRDYGLFGLIFQIVIALVYTYGTGLFLPLLLRYVFYKYPLSKTASGWYSFLNCILNFIFTSTLIILFPDFFQVINEKTFLVPYFILFFVARWVMMLESKNPNEKTQPAAPKARLPLIKNLIREYKPDGLKNKKRYYWKTALICGSLLAIVVICLQTPGYVNDWKYNKKVFFVYELRDFYDFEIKSPKYIDPKGLFVGNPDINAYERCIDPKFEDVLNNYPDAKKDLDMRQMEANHFFYQVWKVKIDFEKGKRLVAPSSQSCHPPVETTMETNLV